MENASGHSRVAMPQGSSFSWTIFASRVLKSGLVLLILGSVLIVLFQVNGLLASEHFSDMNPLSFAGGALALVVLALLGVPTVPAAIAGVSVFWLTQHFFFSGV